MAVARLSTQLVWSYEPNGDVILCGATQLTGEFQQKTRTIPIVFVHVADPVTGGLVESLARPGGNITGFTAYESSIGEKWLEVLKEFAPRLTEVAVLVDPQNPTWMMHVPTMEKAAPSFAVQLTAIHVRNAAEIERSINAFAARSNAGLIVLPSVMNSDQRELITALAARHRMPAVYALRAFVASGGLAYYSSDWVDLYRRAASYVDRILKGAKPADLPVQQPDKVRAGHQPQDRKGARPRSAADLARPRRRGDRMKRREFITSVTGVAAAARGLARCAAPPHPRPAGPSATRSMARARRAHAPSRGDPLASE